MRSRNKFGMTDHKDFLPHFYGGGVERQRDGGGSDKGRAKRSMGFFRWGAKAGQVVGSGGSNWQVMALEHSSKHSSKLISLWRKYLILWIKYRRRRPGRAILFLLCNNFGEANLDLWALRQRPSGISTSICPLDKLTAKRSVEMVPPLGLEPRTSGSTNRRSNQLS